MQQVIASVEQITPHLLTDMLHKAGVLSSGNVESLQCSTALSPTCVMCHLSITYSRDVYVHAPSRLFLKFARSDRDPQLLAQVGVKEVKLYQHLMSNDVHLPTLRCYDAQAWPEQGSFHLLFDDLSSTHEQPASRWSIDEYYLTQTVDCLAVHHSYWWEQQHKTFHVEQLAPEQKLAAEIRTLAEVFPHFIDVLSDRISREDRKVYQQVLGCLRTFWDRPLTLAGKTLVHGDVHFWNILYPRDREHGMPALFDWQTYFVGPGTADLAHLLVLRDPRRTVSRERELVQRYYRQLCALRSLLYSWESCWHEYRRSVVEQLLFPLRWFARHHMTKLGEHWDSYVGKALTAFHDLHCVELLPN